MHVTHYIYMAIILPLLPLQNPTDFPFNQTKKQEFQSKLTKFFFFFLKYQVSESENSKKKKKKKKTKQKIWKQELMREHSVVNESETLENGDRGRFRVWWIGLPLLLGIRSEGKFSESTREREREREREWVERKSKKERESNVWVSLVFIVELVKEKERDIGFIELLPMVF